MKRRQTLLLVLLTLSLAIWIACNSRDSPTAPSPPAADFAAQFDSLWSTFDRSTPTSTTKASTGTPCGRRFVPGPSPRPISASSSPSSACSTPSRYARRLRDPGGTVIATYDPQAFVNWDRSVWQQYLARANWTQGQTEWGYGVLENVPYFAIERWNTASIRAADFDAALERFRSAPRLILDVRMNGGGGDQIAFEIAGRFARTFDHHGLRAIPDGPVT